MIFSDLVRVFLGALAVLLLVVGAVLIGVGQPGFAPLLFGALLLAGVVFERWRYKRLQMAPGAGFEPTEERFADPTTGERVRVYADPRTGERRYVREG